jgi:hypothetical protein
MRMRPIFADLFSLLFFLTTTAQNERLRQVLRKRNWLVEPKK